MDEDTDDAQEYAEQQERAFWQSIIECPQSAKLEGIGNELNKVRMYANEHVINDKLSESIVWITLSAYYAGVTPLLRIEQALNLAKSMNNEYVFALAARAYIEVGGRVHKGIRLWRVFDKDRTQLEQFHNGALRLLGQYTPEGKEHLNIFKSKGFNVMSFVQALSDEVPDIAQVYENLSSYVHGGFGEQRFYRMQSWLAHTKGEPDPIVGGWSDYLDQLRKTVFSDFDLLLNVTRVIRQRYDKSGETDELCLE